MSSSLGRDTQRLAEESRGLAVAAARSLLALSYAFLSAVLLKVFTGLGMLRKGQFLKDSEVGLFFH